jgi:hypothetical protein
MSFTIEQGCPQCGASIELDETDHLLRCPFCNIKSLLYSPDYFRYVLPDKAPDRELIYAPYLRFKGVVYFCKGMILDHRILDITHLGFDFKGIPGSLGVRPQAMKLRFVKPEQKGTFLRYSLKTTDILLQAAKLTSETSKDNPYEKTTVLGNSSILYSFSISFMTLSEKKAGILHRAFIGDTMSIVYLPMYLDGNRLFDAILNRPIVSLPRGKEDLEPLMIQDSGWGPRFISTLCPGCGGAMEGERDSVVLLCRNCHTAWEFFEGNWKRLDFSVAPGKDAESLYIPFWKITAGVRGVEIDSYSDFIRLTNQPMVVSEERGAREMNFFSPAFKIKPNFFLNLARQFTILQRDFPGEETFEKRDMSPVTLPETEAIQALKVILASSAVNKRNIFPNLPRITFEIKGVKLIYIPFVRGLNELIHEDTGMAINRASLEFGRRM